MRTQEAGLADTIHMQGQDIQFAALCNVDLIDQLKDDLPKNKIMSYINPPVIDSSFSFDTNDQQSTERTIASRGPGIAPVIRSSKLPRVVNKFVSLQKWEGVVTGITKETIVARVHDLVNKGIEEEVELSFEEMSKEDSQLIRPGAIFYWNIGYHDSGRGQRTRQSLIRFRRLPAWRGKEIENAKLEAARISESIEWK
jgi:hypothetical protein